MWRPIKKSSDKEVGILLTDAEKEIWETHAITRGIYRFSKVEDHKKSNIALPFEAKEFNKGAAPKIAADPKKPN